jgi:hypothetical protein
MKKLLKTVKLKKLEEFRFEVDFNKYCNVKLINGTAEVFGNNIELFNTNTFTGSKNSLFTWEGCEFEVFFLKLTRLMVNMKKKKFLQKQ